VILRRFSSHDERVIAVTNKTNLRVSLCLLTWNEIDGCRKDIPDLPLDAFDEVFAVDGGSTDGTVEYLTERGIRVFRQETPTYNGAYLSAFLHCSTDALVLFHPKGSIDPSILHRFRPLLDEGYDHVIASRLIRGSVNEEDSKLFRPRKWFVAGLAILSALIWKRGGPVIWDVLHGCRAMKRASFEQIQALPRGLSVDLEMVVRSYRLGLRQTEFPVIEKPRLAGDTHFKAWPTGKALLKYLIQELRRSVP
jgi:glycosyltransferase involved in cell wall biosynthesis